MLHLFERQQRGGDEQCKEKQAARIGAPRQTLRRRIGQPSRQRHRAKADRHIDQEYRLPAEVLGEKAAGDRTERIGADRDRREIALIARALARRNRFADQSLRQGHQAAAAQALQNARQRQQFDGRRHRAQQRGDHEDAERAEHHPAAAERVAEAAVDRRGDGRRDQIGDDDPRRALDLAGRRGDRRQRGGDDGLIDHRQEHRQHDRRKDGEKSRWLRPGGDRRLLLLIGLVRQRSVS